jgi:hypothetical protein
MHKNKKAEPNIAAKVTSEIEEDTLVIICLTIWDFHLAQ